MELLKAFNAKRQTKLQEHNKKIEDIEAKIEKTREMELQAEADLDADGIISAQEIRSELEAKRKTLIDIKTKSLERPTSATDPEARRIWEMYSDEYEKEISPKVKALAKLMQQTCDAYLDVLQIESQAFNDRGEIAKTFSEESGLNKPHLLKFKTKYLPANAQSFVAIFEDELKGEKNSVSNQIMKLKMYL